MRRREARRKARGEAKAAAMVPEGALGHGLALRKHPLVVVLALFAATALCLNVPLGGSLAASTAKTAAAAAVVLVVLACVNPCCLKMPARGKRLLFWQALGVVVVLAAAVVCASWALAVAADAGLLAGGATQGWADGGALAAGEGAEGGFLPGGPAVGESLGSPAVSEPSGMPTAPLLGRAALALALCLFTGLYEEGLFRGVLVDAFAAGMKPSRHALVVAAVASSALFGVLHVEGAPLAGVVSEGADAGARAVALAQLVVKPVQAGLFGLFMVALYVRLKSVLAVALLHAAYDVVVLGPELLLTGMLPSGYVTGGLPDLLVLAASALLLVPAAIWSLRTLAHEEQAYQPAFTA